MLARELEPNRKLPPDHSPSILHGVLAGAGSLWPQISSTQRNVQMEKGTNCGSLILLRIAGLGFFQILEMVQPPVLGWWFSWNNWQRREGLGYVLGFFRTSVRVKTCSVIFLEPWLRVQKNQFYDFFKPRSRVKTCSVVF